MLSAMTNSPTSPTLPLPGPGNGDVPPQVIHSPEPSSGSPRNRRRTTALVATTAVLAGVIGGGVGAVAATGFDNKTSPVTTVSPTTVTGIVAPESVAAVAKQVLPSVVSIEFSGAAGSGEGSGIILNSTGRILTNNHVVAGAVNGGSLTVTFSDGSRTSATIIGRDPVTDLAVIQAKNVNGLTPAKLGSSGSLVVGQPVVAIGSPLGLAGTVTSGIVSAVNRPVMTQPETASGGSGSVLNAIQTDAAINPGNSGGALVNMAGQVVGINSAIASLGSSMGGQSGSIGLGFAIPIDQAKKVIPQLITSGTAQHGQLGITVADATGSELGAKVGSVTPGSAAAKAGLQSGDVIIGYGNQSIDSADALVAAVRSDLPGQQVQVTYLRNGQTHSTTVTLESDTSGSAG